MAQNISVRHMGVQQLRTLAERLQLSNTEQKKKLDVANKENSHLRAKLYEIKTYLDQRHAFEAGQADYKNKIRHSPYGGEKGQFWLAGWGDAQEKNEHEEEMRCMFEALADVMHDNSLDRDDPYVAAASWCQQFGVSAERLEKCLSAAATPEKTGEDTPAETIPEEPTSVVVITGPGAGNGPKQKLITEGHCDD